MTNEPIKELVAVIIHIVRFKSELPDEKVREMFESRAHLYREVKGLVQKYYVRYPETGEHGAVYVWESEAALAQFRAYDLGSSMAGVYEIQGEKVVTSADVLLTLRPAST